MSAESLQALDLKIVAKKYGIWIILLSMLCAAVTFLVCKFAVKERYTSQALIMAQSNSAAGRLENALGGLSGSLGLSGQGEQGRHFEEVLKSRQLASAVTEEDQIKSYLIGGTHQNNLDAREWAAVKVFRDRIQLKRQGDFIRILFWAHNPDHSLEILKKTIGHLEEHFRNHVVTRAKNTELFVKERLEEAKKNLADAEKGFVASGKNKSLRDAEREYQLQSGLVDLLSREYELAQVETKKNDVLFQTIDPPVKPLYPSFPKTKLATVAAFIIALFVFSGLSLIWQGLQKNA